MSGTERPDKILSLLSSENTRVKTIYERVVKLRQSKFNSQDSVNLNEINLNALSLPKVEIVTNPDLRKLYRDVSELTLSFTAVAQNHIDGYNIWVNGVPLYDDKGIKTSNGPQVMTISRQIPLSVGRNNIKVAVHNSQNFWSKKAEYVCYYVPDNPPEPKTYFVGIGMARYQDSSRNLYSSDNDIRNMVDVFKKNNPNHILIDTLINSMFITKKAFKRLKGKLINTNLNDKVILMLSGHGLLSKDKLTWHFATYETDFNHPDTSTTLTFEDIDWLFSGIPARNRLIIIDACHAGQSYYEYVNNSVNRGKKDGGKKDGTKAGSVADELPFNILDGLSEFEPAPDFMPLDYEAFKIITEMFPDYGQNGSTVITACRGEETATEDQENGFFTRALLQVFKENDPGTVTISKLLTEINKKFAITDDQKPSLKSYNPSADWVVW